jgi:leucyl aminopeptidase
VSKHPLDPEEILDIAHIEFSSMALLEPEKLSDYEVKWISDSFDKNDKDVEALKRKEFQSKAKKEKEKEKKKEKEKEAKDNQSTYNYETKNPVAKEAETTQPAIVYNKDFQKTDTKVSSPVHMRVESRLLIEDIKDVEATIIEPEKAAIKHLTTNELQPKKKFVDKIMGFFAKLG